MSCRDRLEAYFQANGVAYQVQQHATAYTAQRVAESEHIPGKRLAKVVMVIANARPVMLVLPASYRVDLTKAGAALGDPNVRLAQENEFETVFPDCEVGAMPPFGNLYNVPVYVDRALAENEEIVFQAGTHTETMSIKYADFQRLAGPTVADFAHHPQTATAR